MTGKSSLRSSIEALKFVARIRAKEAEMRQFGFSPTRQLFLSTSDGNVICDKCCHTDFKTLLKEQKYKRRFVNDVVQSTANKIGPICCHRCNRCFLHADE